ncbi:MAG: glycoside hydrolase family 3 N-terminal domain-containing protein [Acidobacteriota bacterium]
MGQFLFIGLDGPELTPSSREFLTSIGPGGVILFRRNLENPAQIAHLTRSLRTLYSPPPIIAIDQEGGRVSRCSPPFPPLPPAWKLAQLETVVIVRWFGALVGRGLRSLGLQLDLAPVVDLSRAGEEDGIGDRAFSDDPVRAAEAGGEFLSGLGDAGVAGCLKHFPGLGGAPADTHQTLPRMAGHSGAHDDALIPYRRLHSEAPVIMVAHAHYPRLSGEEPLPASLDRRIVHDLLREEIGFRGLAVSDDLEMGAVAARADFGDLAVDAVRAGHDQILICHREDRIVSAWSALKRAAAGGDLPPAALARSFQRIEAFQASPACRRSPEPFVPEEIDLVVHEMQDLTGELNRALRRRGLAGD